MDRQLAGRKATQLQEPEDHALGRSQGGFGTKVHLLCDCHGIILAVFLTAGQRHEAKVFETVMSRVALPRRPGRPRWPERVGGDKAFSCPRIRTWLRRHRIVGVIPTRADERPDAAFDRACYRRRNIIERVVGWYKECRALGTRYEKLAVNYLALWMVAMIDRVLRIRLSNRA
jgi:transposase